MATLLFGVRCILSAVFVVAGIAKLADLPGSRKAIADFGLPERVSGPFGVLLPLVELIVGVGLLPASTAWWGSLAALSLLLLFIGGIGYNLARGKAPDCHCFGQLHSEPIGRSTLVRNIVLAGMAGFVTWQAQTNTEVSLVGWVGYLSIAEQVGLAIVLIMLTLLFVQGWLLLHLLSQNGRLLLRLDDIEAQLQGRSAAPTASEPVAGLAVGVQAPAFALESADGGQLSLDGLRAKNQPVMLLFTDPGCGPCNALLPEVGRWQHVHSTAMTIALISRGTPEINRVKVTEHGLSSVLLQRDREVMGAYQAFATPSAVIVHPNGTIATPLAQGAEAIRKLIMEPTHKTQPAILPIRGIDTSEGSRQMHAASNGVDISIRPMIGDRPPTLNLPDLDGRAHALDEFRGHATLMLFWNPNCGYCRRMLDDLKTWEATRSEQDPRLLVLSTGTVEANRAMGLRAPILLDQGFQAGRAFGAAGTPSGVLIDAEGKIASVLGIGAPKIWQLVNHLPAPAPA